MINYYFCVKYLFPQIKDFQFSVEDSSNGEGQKIVKWDFHKPKPSLEELEAAWPKADVSFRIDNLRKIRNEKLFACDWTHTSDHPLTEEKQKEWKDYRVKLRSILETIDPYDPIWPVEPTEDQPKFKEKKKKVIKEDI